MSFTPGTRVLLADGKSKPISSLKPGDKVLATNTKTGKTSAETVAAVEVNHDHDLYNLKVKTRHGVQVIHTTASHLFWDPALKRWTPAAKLREGERLKTADGTTAVSGGGTTPAVHDGWMWDLTIPGNNDHDFYVLPTSALGLYAYPVRAESFAILVHNSNRFTCSVGDDGNTYYGNGDPGPYERPPGTPTAAQRASVQGYGCATCGKRSPVMIADHIIPLVTQWFSSFKINMTWANSLEAVQPQCPECSNSQGGILSQLARKAAQAWGFIDLSSCNAIQKERE